VLFHHFPFMRAIPFASPSRGSGTLSRRVWHDKRNLAAFCDLGSARHGQIPESAIAALLVYTDDHRPSSVATMGVVFAIRAFSRIRAADDRRHVIGETCNALVPFGERERSGARLNRWIFSEWKINARPRRALCAPCCLRVNWRAG